MNKYLKIWMKSGAYFGMSMGIFYIFQQNNYIAGAISGVVAGLLFGGAMAGITYFADKKMEKKGVVNESVSVNQTQSLIISLPFETVEPVIQEAVLSVPKAKIKSISHSSVEAKTGFTWKSFGEDIVVSLERKDSSTIAKINSKSSVKTTMVDYGKNLENVKNISSFIKQKFDGEVRDCT
jgi:hypothetical protein